MWCLYTFVLLILVFVIPLGRICGCEVKNGTNHCFVEEEREDISHRNTEILENDVRNHEALSKVRGQERIFEQQLEAFLRAILENGIPDLGIPDLDPFVNAGNISISDIDLPGMMTVEHVELGDFEIIGLSRFLVQTLTLQLANIQIVFNLTFPIQVKANHIDFRVIIGDLIPFYGNGTANLIADLRLEGLIAIGTVEDDVIYIETLLADIFFDSLKVEISSLMGVTDGKTNHIFNSLIGEVTPELIDLMKPMVIDGILESVREAVNGFLIPMGLTFMDLVNCFLGSGNCPIPLP